MSDRVAVFNDGSIQQLATPMDLYEGRANAFVASFVGENNGLTGRVTAVENGHAVLAVAPGVTVRGRAGTDLSRGGEAVLALRPEKLSFGREATDGENRLSGTVDEIIYCGDHWRLHLTAAGRSGLIMKMPNRAASAAPAPGQRRDDLLELRRLQDRGRRARLSGLTSSLCQQPSERGRQMRNGTRHGGGILLLAATCLGFALPAGRPTA